METCSGNKIWTPFFFFLSLLLEKCAARNNFIINYANRIDPDMLLKGVCLSHEFLRLSFQSFRNLPEKLSYTFAPRFGQWGILQPDSVACHLRKIRRNNPCHGCSPLCPLWGLLQLGFHCWDNEPGLTESTSGKKGSESLISFPLFFRSFWVLPVFRVGLLVPYPLTLTSSEKSLPSWVKGKNKQINWVNNGPHRSEYENSSEACLGKLNYKNPSGAAETRRWRLM